MATSVLVVDVGGTHVKILSTGQDEPRKIVSGPRLTPQRMVSGVKKLARGWTYDGVSIGYPGVVLRGRAIEEPHNLAKGWAGCDYRAAMRRPAGIINAAPLQAQGRYQKGATLVFGVRTAIRTALAAGR